MLVKRKTTWKINSATLKCGKAISFLGGSINTTHKSLDLLRHCDQTTQVGRVYLGSWFRSAQSLLLGHAAHRASWQQECGVGGSTTSVARKHRDEFWYAASGLCFIWSGLPAHIKLPLMCRMHLPTAIQSRNPFTDMPRGLYLRWS